MAEPTPERRAELRALHQRVVRPGLDEICERCWAHDGVSGWPCEPIQLLDIADERDRLLAAGAAPEPQEGDYAALNERLAATAKKEPHRA